MVTLGLAILLSNRAQPDWTIAKADTAELPFARDLQRVLDLSLRITNGTGISAAVIVPGQGTWTGVAGCSEPSKAMSPDMLFDIASIGKNFVAILVCKLAEEGRLSLDDPLNKWLPDYPNIDNGITIRQLLNHTSGLFDWVEHPQSPYRRPFNTVAFEEVSSPEQVVTRLVGAPYFSPGRGFHYSSTNYTLLRIVVENVTGSTIAREIRTRFLEPLSLDHTFVLDAETCLPGTMRVAHAWFDIEGNGKPADITSRPVTWIATRSPALMYCSAEDLARWSQTLYGGKVLSQTSSEQVLTFHRPTPTAPGEPFATGYGLGTQELRLGGLVMWGHLGWQYGYTSSMFYVPKRSASIVVLINDNNMMLMNLAAIALCIVTEYHLGTTRFLLLSGSALLLSSMFVLWPLSFVARFLRKPRRGSVVSTHTEKLRTKVAGWIALLAGILIAAAAVLYFGYSLNPVTPLSWSAGNRIVKWFISLSITSGVVAVSLVFLTVHVWMDRLWSAAWRLHYTLVTLAGLIAAFSLLRLLFA